jgi:hypothetical protein
MRPYSRVAAVVAASLLGPAAAQALDWRVRVVNDSSHTMVGFYGINVDADGWGANRLGGQGLLAGDAVVVNFEDGSGYCRFRFRAVFDDDVELTRPNVNVCEVGTYRYTD